MAGADHSGEEMQTGRTNRAENRTRIWAQREEDSDFDPIRDDAGFKQLVGA